VQGVEVKLSEKRELKAILVKNIWHHQAENEKSCYSIAHNGEKKG
jgi:hypothetical protein